MILWFAIIFVAVLTAGVVLYPLLRRLPPAESSEAAEMAIYKDQLNELKSDVERGVITAEEAASAETEISRRLLEAAERLRISAEAAKKRHTRAIKKLVKLTHD